MRLTARGDVVFSSPVVRALRRTYPDARISWFGEAHTKDLIEHHPELHRVFFWDRRRWKKLFRQGKLFRLTREFLELAKGLRAERFDLAIDMQGMVRSGVIALLSGARNRIVMRPKEGSHLLFDHVVDRYRDQGNPEEICAHYRFLARELDLDSGDFRMEVPLHPDDRAYAEEVIQKNGLGEGFVVAVPFTTRPQKHWFEDRWAELMERISGELGLATVILGGPPDLEADTRIRSLTEAEPISLVGETTLRQASAIIEKASLVIGVDTGLTHIGIAFDRPTIGIYGSNIPYTETFTDKTRLLIHWLDCVPCKGNPTCDGDFTCLKLISVDEVMGAAGDLIGAGAGSDR
jgi:heptosyltransferase-1